MGQYRQADKNRHTAYAGNPPVCSPVKVHLFRVIGAEIRKPRILAKGA